MYVMHRGIGEHGVHTILSFPLTLSYINIRGEKFSFFECFHGCKVIDRYYSNSLNGRYYRITNQNERAENENEDEKEATFLDTPPAHKPYFKLTSHSHF